MPGCSAPFLQPSREPTIDTPSRQTYFPAVTKIHHNTMKQECYAMLSQSNQIKNTDHKTNENLTIQKPIICIQSYPKWESVFLQGVNLTTNRYHSSYVLTYTKSVLILYKNHISNHSQQVVHMQFNNSGQSLNIVLDYQLLLTSAVPFVGRDPCP